jgi:myo-inositol-1(or 4)-monophosphatase
MTAAVPAGEIAHARDAVLEAGRIAMGFFRQEHERWEKGPGQVVTEADVAIDRFLHRELLGRHPEDGWLSEETEDDRARLGRRRVWVVDPIDGTRSFAEGTPEFTVCVGLLVDGAPVLGFVLNPATEEMFEARLGEGAYRNGERLRASGASSLAGARIAASKFESRKRNFASLFPTAQLTGIGSLAYKLALVASGRFDGYLSWRRTHDWDIAAAVLILEEAGAVITEAGGGAIRLNQPEPRHPGLIAAGPTLHAPLLAATKKAYRLYAEDRRARGLPV